MEEMALGPLAASFATLTDPRVDRTKEHLLLDIVLIAICAVVCGAEGWVEVAEFGEAKRDWFSRFLKLPNGTQARRMTPSGACLRPWMRSSSSAVFWSGCRR